MRRVVARDKEEDRSRFDRALREWGGRQPRTSPGTAATRVRGNLSSRPPRLVQRPVFGLAAAVLVLLIGAWWLFPGNGQVLRTAPTSSQVATIQTLALDDNVVLWWLDPETPVYFVLAPPER